MAAKPSLTGITPERFDKTDRTPGTGVTRSESSAEEEAGRMLARRGRATYATPAAPSTNAMQRAAQGNKVAGATRTRGGAL